MGYLNELINFNIKIWVRFFMILHKKQKIYI